MEIAAPKSLSELPNVSSMEIAAPTSLSELPTEILIQIFESADHFVTVSALSRTSHALRSIYKDALPAISTKVLPRAIYCFEEAQELIAAQERAAGSSYTLLERIKGYLSNARIVKLAYLDYQETGEGRLKAYRKADRPQTMKGAFTDTVRTHFHQALYSLITLSYLTTEPLPYNTLASMNLLTFRQLKEVMDWLELFSSRKVREPLGIEEWVDGRVRWSQGMRTVTDWGRVRFGLAHLDFELDSVLKSSHPIAVYSRKMGHRPEWGVHYWTLQELHVTEEESGENISLAEVLPLVSRSNMEVAGFKILESSGP